MIRMSDEKRRSRSSDTGRSGSERAARRAELASKIAGIVLQEGLGDLALRGLADRLGTSDRMLLYYFGTKDQLILDVMEQAGSRLAGLLANHSGGPQVSPGQFLAGVLALARQPAVAPFMQLWTEVIARGARGERPYDQVGANVVRSWIAWIESRLMPSAGRREPARPAALLSIVEGITLLEMAAPGCTEDVQAYLSRALDTDLAIAPPPARSTKRSSKPRGA